MERDVRLLLQLNGVVDYATFEQTAHDFAILLRDAEAAVVQAKGKVAWRWEDDATISIVASPNGASEEALTQIAALVRAGFESIATAEKGAINWPPPLGGKAKNSIKRIVRRLDEVDSIVVETPDAAPLVIEHVEFVEEAGRHKPPAEHTSIDGVIDLISVRGHLHFSIEEHGSGRRIRCSVSDDLLPQLKDALGKRVVIEGVLQYGPQGTPVLIRNVSSIWTRPDETRPLEDLIGSLPDLTGGVSPGEYVRRIRSGDDDGE